MMNNLNNIMAMVGQIKQNPRKILSQRFNIPENLCNNPNDILQHLLNSGQVSQAQVNNAMQMRNMFMK